jgi:hypothetical protein
MKVAGYVYVGAWLTPEQATALKRESDKNIRAALAQYIEADKAAQKRRELQSIEFELGCG